MNAHEIDPAMNLLHNDAVMRILQEAVDRLEALGMACALVPGGLRPREDHALPISLFVAPNEDSLLDLRAGDNLAVDMAITVQGQDAFNASRAFVKAQDAEYSSSARRKT